MSVIDVQEDIITEDNSLGLSTNDDLKDLCILLDEERYKMHQLAEQWKHFGTSSIHKLESQIIDYQEKLNDLEQRQMLLLKENDSLKSLVNQMMTTTINNTSTIDVWENKKTRNLIYFYVFLINKFSRKNLNKMFQHKHILKNRFLLFQ